MDRNFFLPVTIAAAVHAGLLLGPGAPAKPAPIKPVSTALTDAFEFLLPLEILPPETPPEDASTGGGASSAAPTLPELLMEPTLKDFVIATPEVPPTVVHHVVSTLPLGRVGPESIGDDFTRPAGPGVLRLGDLENSPRTRSQPSPVYPFEAKKDGREGRVTVEFTVDESGAVLAPRVVESSDRVFDEAAMRAVAKWRFEPGRREGHNVRFRMAVPIIFSLNQD